MTEIGLGHYLTLGAVIFSIGVIGIFLNRKNIIVILMSIELILLAVNINLVSFSIYLGDLTGQVFTLFILTVAAAEAAIGLAIIVVYYRNAGTIRVEEIDKLKDKMEISIISLPLIASIISGFFGKFIGDRNSEIITSLLVSISALLSAIVFYEVIFNQYEENIIIATWINSGSLEVNWSMKIDALSAVMLVVVTFISALVHIYSIGYMSHDPHKPIFMAYLSLFTLAMLMLVTADNFIQLFFGWEGVGLCSYF